VYPQLDSRAGPAEAIRTERSLKKKISGSSRITGQMGGRRGHQEADEEPRLGAEKRRKW